jgi:hypothetical protein
LTRSGVALDIGDELLLLGFELGPFPVELALGFLECALVLAHALCGSLSHPEEGVYDVHGWRDATLRLTEMVRRSANRLTRDHNRLQLRSSSRSVHLDMGDPRISSDDASRLNAAAAVRNYGVHPRLDYRTVSAINGPVSERANSDH